MTSWSATSLALVSLLLVACGSETSASTADDPEQTPSVGETSSAARPLDDFPLARGYPETNGDDGSPVAVTGESGVDHLDVCHEGAWTPGFPVPPVDLVGATYTGEAEDVRGRTLARYVDAEEAEHVLSSLRAGAEGCPEDEGRVHEVTTRRVGDGALLITTRYRGEYGFGTGLVVVDAVRVGDLLLVNFQYGEGGGSDQTIKWSQREVTDQSEDLLPEMCEYAVPACPVREPAPVVRIGPEGIDGVTLGMSVESAEQAGLLGYEPRHDGTGCAVGVRDDGTTLITGDLRPGVGLVDLRAPRSVVETPEGVGTGMSWHVYATYPDARDDERLVTTPVPGHPENAYWFVLDADEFITDVLLVRVDDHCLDHAQLGTGGG